MISIFDILLWNSLFLLGLGWAGGAKTREMLNIEKHLWDCNSIRFLNLGLKTKLSQNDDFISTES